MEKLLALDLSTNATGWALFENGKLHAYGLIKPGKIKGISTMKYPKQPLLRMRDMADQIRNLVIKIKPDHIVIEEVNRSINRIGQKALDSLHFFTLEHLMQLNLGSLDHVSFMDSNGRAGWRPTLNIKLSEMDKNTNKEIRANHAKLKRQKKVPRSSKPVVINWKTLACRYVNDKYNIGLSSDLDPKTDGDIADAICLGDAYIEKNKE